ncbi:MAG: baseplate J/gp47 family protein, partial [Sporomusa sp.]
GVKVYPVWQGGGTVRVVFMTSEYKPPSTEFVSSVQETIDPIPFQQLGIGIAPIGHFVTVQGAQDSSIDIGLNLTFVDGYTFTDLQDNIETVIDSYFSELNQSWPSTQIATTELLSNTGLVVRVSQIESRLLTIAQIIDAQDTTLNGVADNLTLGTDELAVRGAVSG